MRPSVVWFTGLPASGKTSIAFALADEIRAAGGAVVRLDGDELRQGICSDLSFGRLGRHENARRAAQIARLTVLHGVYAVVSLISPYKEDRAMARKIAGSMPFFEVWVSTPLSVCSQRDPKGLYRDAREGKLKQMTGVDGDYEAPENPDVTVDTTVDSAEACAMRIMAALKTQGRLP